METKLLVDSLPGAVGAEMTWFIGQESEIKCPLEYETRALAIGRSVSRNLILGVQGKLPKSRNTNNSSDLFWQI